MPRCTVTPVAGHQVSFAINGHERLRWHSGDDYPRPYFYPLLGPSGQSLTRMGHPGAPNHDHHQSIWFAHNKVLGIDFWGYTSKARIRQQEWLAYVDGDDEAIMAVKLGWYDGHDPRELMTQQLVVGMRPGADGETLLELQSTFTPTANELELGKTNFGFLAVRVAKSISAYFGGGQLTDSEGRVGEPAIFGQQAKWMDYSGPISGGPVTNDAIEGITFFDHPSNPGHPTHWHVREDGWMGASACFEDAKVITKEKPLNLRYLLHAHAGPADNSRSAEVFADFAKLTAYVVEKATVKHTAFTVRRT